MRDKPGRKPKGGKGGRANVVSPHSIQAKSFRFETPHSVCWFPLSRRAHHFRSKIGPNPNELVDLRRHDYPRLWLVWAECKQGEIE
jgi:hypothetical protein